MFRRLSIFAFLLGIALLALSPAAHAFGELRVVSSSDTPGANYLDGTVGVGDTITVELWVEADTDFNGFAAYLRYDGGGLRLRETADATDSFPTGNAGIQADEDHTTFGDVLLNQGDWKGDATDTFYYAALTNADSVQGSFRAVRMSFTAETTGVWTIVYTTNSSLNQITSITAANAGADSLWTSSDTGVIEVVVIDTPVIEQLTFASDTPLRFFDAAPFDTAPGGDTVWFAAETQTVTMTLLMTTENPDSIQVSGVFGSGTQTDTTDSFQAQFNIAPQHASGETTAMVFAYNTLGNVDTLILRFVPDTVPPDTVANVYPLNGVIDPSPTFEWTSSADTASGVGRYKVEVSDSDNFATIVASDSTMHPDTDLTISTLPAGTYFWRVLTYDNVGNVTTAGLDVDTFSTAVDTAGPNAWYINDTATGGDVYTTKIGADTATGTLPSDPLRSFAAVAPQLSAGDTIFVDAGFFYDSNILIDTDQITIIGVDSSLTFIDVPASTDSGFLVSNAQRFSLKQVRVGGAGYAVVLSNGDSAVVEDNNFPSSNRAIVAHSGASDITVRNNLFTGDAVRFTGVDSSLITQNTLSGYDTGIELLSSSTGVTISLNTAQGNGTAIRIDGSTNNSVDQNLISNSSTGVDLVNGADSNTITDNSVDTTGASGTAFLITSSQNNSFTGNTANGGGLARGFVLSGADNNTFSSNTATNLTADRGFWLGAGSDNNRLTANTSTNNARGFEIGGSANNMIESNVATNNSVYGLFIDGAQGNIVHNNSFSSGGDVGVGLAASTGNAIVQNEVRNNAGYGFTLLSTAGGDTITKNNIITAAGTPDSGVNSTTDTFVTSFIRNWWGTADSSVIRARINGTGSDSIDYIPFRLGVVDTTTLGDTVAPNAPDTVAADTIVNGTPSDSSLLVSWSISTGSEEAEGAAGLTGHRVYRAQSPDTSVWIQIAQVGAAVDSYVDSGLSSLVRYYYRVTAFDASTPENESYFSDSVAGETVPESSPPSDFTLLIPTEGGDTNVTSIRFEWSAATDSSPPVSYRLIVDTDMAGAFVADTTVTDTSEIVVLPANDTYLWRVIATDALGNSRQVGDSSFIVDTITPQPAALILPADNYDTSATTITFTWTSASDSTSGLREHRLQVDTAGTFASLLFDSSTGTNTTGALTLAANDTYFWRVLAVDNAGNTAPTAGRRLIVDTEAPVSAVLLTPAEGTETSAVTLTFTWTSGSDSLSGLASHRIQIDTSGTFVNLLVDSSAGINTDTTFTLPANDTYHWRVITADNAGNTIETSDSSFFIDTIAPTVAILTDPADGTDTNLTTIRFAWTASNDTGSGLAGYTIQIDTSGAFTSNLIDSSTGLMTDTTLTLPANDTYFWRVISADDAGNTVAISADSVLIDTGVPTLSTLLTPVNGSGTNAVSVGFNWTDAVDTLSGLAGYRIQVDTGGTFVAGSITADSTATTSDSGMALSDGIYFWRVRSIDEAGNVSAYTGTESFTVDRTAPVITSVSIVSSVPTFFSDSGGIDTTAVQDTVFFNNSGIGAGQNDTVTVVVNGAETVSFPLRFGDGPSFDTTLPYEFTYSIETGIGDTVVIITATDTSGNQDSVTINWIRDTVAPIPAVLSNPTDNITTGDTTPTLSWAASNDTLSGTRDYVVQIGIDTVFSTVLEAAVVSTTSYTSSGLGDSLYYWRVIPYDTVSNADTASATIRRFTVDSGVPFVSQIVIVSSVPSHFFDDTPVTPGLVPDTVYYNPTGPGAGQMDTITVFVQDSNESWVNASVVFNPIQRTDTGLNADSYTLIYQIPQDSPSSLVTISVFDNTGFQDTVNVFFEADTAGPTAPTAITPANGHETTATTIRFEWNASSDTGSGLAGYTVQIDTSGAFTSNLIDSSTGLTTDTTLTLPANDTYFWRVIAVDNVANTTAITAQTVVIDTAAPTAAVLTAPADGTETTATTLQFTWTASVDTGSGLSGYTIQVDTSGTFTNNLVDSSTGLTTDTTLTLPANDTYFWRVISADDAGNTIATAADSVLIDTAPPTVAVLTAPADGTETTAVTMQFTWAASVDTGSGLSGYTIQIDTSGAFTNNLIDSSTGLSTDTTLSLPANDTYFWRVISADDAGNTIATSADSVLIDTAAPTIAVLTAPADGTETAATTLLFTWTVSTDTGSGLAGYTIQVDTSGAFTNNLVDSSTGLTADTTLTLPANDTYFWRVISADDAGNTIATAADSVLIDTAPPTVAVLTAPADVTETTATTLQFTWMVSVDTGTGLSGYTIQIDTSGSFTSNLIDSSTGLSADTTLTLPANDTYFWRVISADDAGNTVATAADSVLIDTAPPTVPTLVSPINGDTSPTTVNLDWNASTDTGSGFFRYRVQVDTSGAFTTGLQVDSFQTTPDTTITLAVDTYFWRVISEDDAGNTVAVTAESFVVAVPAETQPPDTFTLLTPSDSTDTNEVSIAFTWSVSTDSTGPVTYRILVDTSGTFTSNVIDSSTGINTDTTLVLPANDTYFWRVIAQDGNGDTRAAGDSVIRIDTAAPSLPALTNPTGGETVVSNTAESFTWTASSDSIVGLLGYRIQIDTAGTFAGTLIVDTFQTTPDTTFTFIAEDTYFWRVIVSDNLGNSDTTPAESFLVVVPSETQPPDTFTLLTPADNTDTNEVSIAFTWSASSDSTGPVTYRILIDTTGAFTNNVIDSTTGINTDTTLVLPANDTYFWRVIAQDGNGDTRAAGDSVIRIDTAVPSLPTLTNPTGGESIVVNAAENFTWTASSDSIVGVAGYRIQIDTAGTFAGTLIVDTFQTTPDTTFTFVAVDTYFWRVIVSDGLGNSDTTPAESFLVVVPSETQPPDTFTLLTPAGNTDTTEVSIAFTWSASSDSTGPVTYRILVDTSGAFTSNVIDSSTGINTDTTLILSANDTYFWRVIAQDGNGDTRAAGDSMIRIDTAAPSLPALTNPTGGESVVVNTAESFTWTASSDSIVGLTGYRIQIDTVGTFAGTLIVDTFQTTPDTTFTFVAVDTYFWRVIVADNLGNSDTTPAESFLVVVPAETRPPDSFTLLAPVEADQTNATSILFTWSASNDSSLPITYRLYVDTDMFGAAVADTTTTSTSLTLTLAANDTYIWRVTATDNAGNATTVGDSSFSIDTIPPTSPTLISPIGGAAALSPVLLDWTTSTDARSGVMGYWLQVSTSPTLASGMAIDSNLTTADTIAALAFDTYYWRVTAFDSAFNSIATAIDSFVVAELDTGAPIFPSPTTASPNSVSNSGTTTVTFTVIVDDSTAVAAVVINLLEIGQGESTALTKISDTTYTVNVDFGPTVVGDDYDLLITAIDISGNSGTTTVAITVIDNTPSFSEVIDTPFKDLRAAGGAISVISTYGDSFTSVRYEYRPENSAWTLIETLSQNPDTQAPFWGVFWNVPAALPDGVYDVRAVGTDLNGVEDTNPGFIRVTLDRVNFAFFEDADSQGRHFRRQIFHPDTTSGFVLADGGTALTVDSGSVAETVWIRVTLHDTVPAATPLGSGFQLPPGMGVHEFVREDGKRTFASPITLTLPYADSDLNDDKVGGSEIMEKALAIYHFDEELGVWVKEPTSLVDPARNTVSAQVSHFTIFAVLASAPADATLSDVVVYPNPFIPHDNNDRTGRTFVGGVPGTGITFDNLTTTVDVIVYNAAGREVARFAKRDSTSNRYHWDARNDDGRELASGMYIAIIRSGTGEQIIKKIMIIR